MGKDVCSICNNEAGFGKVKLKDGVICGKCFKACGYNLNTIPINDMTVERIRNDLKMVQNNLELVESFVPSKQIGTYVEFDETQKKWLIPDGFLGKKKNPKVHNYSDIIDCDLLVDEDSIIKGGLGRAVAGGVLFGGVGAIVGGVTGGKKSKSIVNSMKIKITLNDVLNPTVYITLINAPTKTSSIIYKSAEKFGQEILSVMAIILNENSTQKEPAATQTLSSADELRKYKGLLDDGIISQEEYEAKKKQILGL